MVTMQDIASRAGVSKSTVSHIMNGRDTALRISETTRERVMATAQELGYRRNGSASAMSLGRFGCAALLTSTRPTYSYVPHSLMQGINSALGVHDMHLTLAMLSDEQLTDENFMPKILREWLVDGLLIDYIRSIPVRLVEMIERHEIPVIWINAKQAGDCVFPDDYGAGRRATEHLLELGHRSIAFVDYSHTPSLEQEHYSAADREHGYRDAMQAARLKPRVIRETGVVPSADRAAYAKTWLSQPQRPTAVLTYRQIDHVYMAALDLGLKVPQDLSLMSFGEPDIEFAGIPVTCMTESNEAIGTQAVQMLLEKIKNPNQILAPATVPFGFQVGKTCAPLERGGV